MSRFSIVEPQSTVAAGKVNVHNCQHILDAAIAVLREIDARYAHDRARLEASAEETQRKRRWLAQLEARAVRNGNLTCCTSLTFTSRERSSPCSGLCIDRLIRWNRQGFINRRLITGRCHTRHLLHSIGSAGRHAGHGFRAKDLNFRRSRTRSSAARVSGTSTCDRRGTTEREHQFLRPRETPLGPISECCIKSMRTDLIVPSGNHV